MNPDVKFLLSLPLQYTLSFIDWLSPKDDKLILFGSELGRGMTGSPKALYDWITECHPDYDAHFFQHPKNVRLGGWIKWFMMNMPLFFKCRHIVTSHPTNDFFPFISWSKRKNTINTWHGTPIKTGFYTDASRHLNHLPFVDRISRITDHMLVSSKLEGALISEAFQLDPLKLSYTGHPRNDIALKKKGTGKVELSPFQYYVLYAPTYRRDKPTEIFPFPDFDPVALQDFLEKNKMAILLRKHIDDPMPAAIDEIPNVIDFSFAVCPDIYTRIHEMDMLITDYSSLYVDYLLLDRPCAFVPYDLKEYENKRGLSLDNYAHWMAGDVVLTMDELIRALQELTENKDRHADRRRQVRDVFHIHQDAGSCERVFSELIAPIEQSA